MAYPPSSLPTNRDDNTPTPNNHAGDHNNADAAINGIVAELGTGPKGTAADVTSRLALIDRKLGDIVIDAAADYGATPIGTTPGFVSTTQINQAISDASAAGGGEVRLPRGEFWGNVTLASNVWLILSAGCILRSQPGVNTPIVTVPATGYRMGLRGGEIYGRRLDSTPGTEDGVYVTPRSPSDSTVPTFTMVDTDIRDVGGRGWYVGAGAYTTRGDRVQVQRSGGNGIDIYATDGWYDMLSVGGVFGAHGIALNNVGNIVNGSQVWYMNTPADAGIGWYIGAVHQMLSGCSSEDNATGMFISGSVIAKDFVSHGDLQPVIVGEFNNAPGRGGYSRVDLTVGQNDRYKPLFGFKFTRAYRGEYKVHAEWDTFSGASPYDTPNLDPDFKYFVDASVDFPDQAQFYGTELHVAGEDAFQPYVTSTAVPSFTPDLRNGHKVVVEMTTTAITINAPLHWQRVPRGGTFEFHFKNSVANPVVTWNAAWIGAPALSSTNNVRKRVVFQNWGTLETPVWRCMVNANDTDVATGYQPLDATLTALAGMSTAADKLAYWTGVDTVALTDLSAFIRTLLDDADAATARTTLGLGSSATHPTTDFDTAGAAAAAQAASVPLATVTTADDLIVGSGNAAVTRLGVAASRIIGKKATGAIGALTAAEVKAILSLVAADVTGVEATANKDVANGYMGIDANKQGNNPPQNHAKNGPYHVNYVRRTGAIAEAFERRGFANTAALTSGRETVTGIEIAKSKAINHITFLTGSTAATTPTHWWMTIRDSSYNLLATTSDKTTTAIAANSEITCDLSAAYTTLVEGLFYAGLVVVATTVPSLATMPGSLGTGGTLAPLLFGIDNTNTGLTTPATAPATGGPYVLGVVASQPYANVS